MTRIAVVDLMFHWPPTGGSMVDICEVTRRLQARGHDVKMFVPDFSSLFPRGKITQPPGFPVQGIPFNRYTFNYKIAPTRFRRAVEDFKPDVVFMGDGFYLKPHISEALRDYPQVWRTYAYEIFCPKNNLVDVRLPETCPNHIFLDQARCLECFKMHLGYKRPLVKIMSHLKWRLGAAFMVHEYWSSLAFKPQFLEVYRRALERAQHIIVYNSRQAELMRPFNQKIAFAPTGINESFKPVFKEPAAGGPVKILMSGRANDPVKGYGLLLHACRFLWQHNQDFELLATLRDGEDWHEFPFLKKLGWFRQEEIPELMSRADILCVPSLWEEAFGIVAIEGMACGKPVLATRAGGLKETVVNGETGVLVRPRDSYDIYLKLKTLIAHPALRERMGKAGIERVDRLYRWDGIMDRVYRPIFG